MRKLIPASITMLIIDREGRVIGILAGYPEDGDWEAVQRDAQKQMEEARTRLTASYACSQHRCGAFATLRTSVAATRLGAGLKLEQVT